MTTEAERSEKMEAKAKQINAVNDIKEHTDCIEKCILKIATKSVAVAFKSSVENLYKKCEMYGKEKIVTSPDEKRTMREAAQMALADFRAKKESDAAISTSEESRADEPIAEISESEMGTKSKKIGKRH